MTIGSSTTTTLNDLLPEIIQEAQFVFSERSIMKNLVKNYVLSPGQGKHVNVPIYPIQTAGALSEGQEIASTAISTDTAQLTVAPVAIRTLLTDLARTSAATNVVADLGRLFGEAVARKIDQDLLALFSGSFTNAVGSASTTISAASIFQAVAKLKSQGVPTDGLACVLHPAIAYDLKANLTNTFANPASGDVQNEAMRMGYVGMLAGVPIYETSNITNNGTTGDYYGGLFHRDAFGVGMIGDIAIETQRRASYLGDDIICSASYGVGVLYEQYNVQLLNDSSIL